MAHSSTPVSTAACEDAICADRQYNIENGIWPDSVLVADRFLQRRLELVDAYAEIHAKLGSTPRGLRCFFDFLFGAVTVWGPDEMKQARLNRQTLVELNQQIQRQANALADLIDRRTDLSNSSGFSCNTHYHVIDVMEKAGASRSRFEVYVQKPLASLRSQFDLKYWPTPVEFVRELARDAGAAEPAATDPVTQAATAGRAANSDFFKALFKIIKENSARMNGPFPTDLEMSDKTLASLGNCALDLAPDELITDDYVKGIRQRLRAVSKRTRKGNRTSPATDQ